MCIRNRLTLAECQRQKCHLAIILDRKVHHQNGDPHPLHVNKEMPAGVPETVKEDQ